MKIAYEKIHENKSKIVQIDQVGENSIAKSNK